jgi:DNA-binding IclR family transcriptional regulator
MKPAISVEKVCRIFDAFRTKASLGITELAERTSLLPSDVHRLLRSLECFGYVVQDEDTRKYRLGLELLKLGHLVHQRIELREVARPFMRHLSEAAQATANLAVFDPHDLEVIFIEQVDSPNEVQIRLRIGRRVPAHATAVGKVLLAHLDRATVRRVLKKHGMQKLTCHTITDPATLDQELDAVMERGVAADHEEALLGACCIAAAVRDHRGNAVAALSISMMASHLGRDDEPRLVALVRHAAREISAALGAESPPSRRSPERH